MRARQREAARTGTPGRRWRSIAARTLALAGMLAAGAAAAFDLQGHRGARGLAPENTLPGIERALEVGVTTLELDVVMTRDGVPVVGHDRRLNPALVRDADGRWLDEPTPVVLALDLAQLQRFDVGRLRPGTAYAAAYPEQQPVDGTRMPTLAQVFERVAALGAREVRFNLETKISPLEPETSPEPEAFVRALLAVVDAHGVRGRVSLQSFDWRTLDAARALAPEIPRVALTMSTPRFDNLADARWTAGRALAAHGSVPKLAQTAQAQVWSPFHGNLTRELLAEARALGMAVIPWTVNEPADIERLLDWGVDGLISDHPERVRDAMARRGLPLPATPPARRQ
ncbi:MAG: glycerophosphodiester phosphodiesterase [Burkholderiaceae bacterium]|jgi:glycerophosphoryl diester phosphodiesterase|nr:glycerophosphodiester phosphodiesterase [Burkholderiaceae bacterium]